MCKLTRAIAFIFLSILITACAAFERYRDTDVAMTSMAVFDPARYAGTWFEVASFPVPFQQGCRNTTATYGTTQSGALTVLNRCETDEGIETIGGTATVAGPGRLKVRLDGVPFAADYWVLWVDDAYQTAVIGVPSGRAGWVLNRTPDITPDRLQAARDVLTFNGYDVSRLSLTPQVRP